jgi:hypothetical protein
MSAQTSTTKKAAKAEYVSLTHGGAKPMIFGASIPAEIVKRHAYLFTFLEKSGLSNAREISFFIGIRPDKGKSARVSDFFKFSGKNKPAEVSDKFVSEKLSIAQLIKKYPELKPVGKFTDSIIYLTVFHGTKQFTIHASYKY